jgi:SMC interacting uncharacterized protein involved in chromosome segregation
VSELAQLTKRVSRLEERMDDVQDLAGRTGQEVAGWRTTLNNHTRLLNTIKEDQADLRKKVEDGFAKVDENFAEVEKKFQQLHQGQERITKLLTRHLGEPDQEPHTGGADE